MKVAVACALFLFLDFQISAQDPLYFPPVGSNAWETLSPDSLNWCEDRIQELYQFLDDRNTKAFILLKGGRIVLEHYFDGFTQDSVWYWASAGKTVTATLAGIGQQEGFLDIYDPVSDYLGTGWTAAPVEKESLITIRNQLTMTSGLDDAVADPYCTDPDCLLYKADAGSRWAYHNGPYTLLTKVIEAATGMNYNLFYYSRLAQKTGMEGLWIYTGFNRLLYSNARTMARFGLLIQNGGIWDNTPVLADSGYFDEMVHPSQDLNKSYGYLWWLNGQETFMLPGSQFVFPGSYSPDAPDDMFAALGANAQYLNIAPSLDLVFVRMGESPDNSLVPVVFNNEIWQHINNLACSPNASREEEEENGIILYPNPVRDVLHIKFTDPANPDLVRISNLLGHSVMEVAGGGNIDLSTLPAGLYFCTIYVGERSFTGMISKTQE